MGYTKVIQYAGYTEVFEYEKILHKRKKKTKRRRSSKPFKSEYSLNKSRSDFFKLVLHNIHEKGLPVFMTLTACYDFDLSTGYKYLGLFKRNVKNTLGEDFSYIAVPEWQKKSGRLHFHLLCWGLCPKRAKQERRTRTYQKLYSRGFMDIRIPTRDSKAEKLAGYLTKYMHKSNQSGNLKGRRCYSASRNIIKFSEVKSNSLSQYLGLIVGDNLLDVDKETSYNTKYLGRCVYKRYNIKK